ncbi:hypothetical protein [Okeania sp. SIO2B3]|uniref:hypothetical protein n=1 Tax=Okeania sp. SIO2B3 TaxID=2607784 RepID=UPI0013C1597E|nr:hypothetical protein [Okeania sp. SIO2B3]NET45884.1 hypothetical protein [Okeania sp. SIO2B3]
MFKKIILTLLLSFCLEIPCALSQAVKNIPVGVAKGDVDGGATITVWLGHGLNLDFSSTGEIIRKVWLDDPSRVIVDFDGNIGGGGARIVHLRRINPVDIPELPSAPSTLLTIVTEGEGNTTNLYSFRINYGSGLPEYTTVRVSGAVVASAPSPSVELAKGSLNKSSNTSSEVLIAFDEIQLSSVNLEKGLLRQCWGGLIPLSAWRYGKAKNFLTLINRGIFPDDALSQSGVSIEDLMTLTEIGRECEI